MNNPATIKRRKKLRHERHKREADKYREYLNSEKYEDDLKKSIKEFLNKK